jgi:hypothetical protein
MAKEERDDATVDLESVTNAGKRLKLKGRELEKYVHDHMTGFGYKSKRSYFKTEESDDDSVPFWRRGKSGDDDDDDL